MQPFISLLTIVLFVGGLTLLGLFINETVSNTGKYPVLSKVSYGIVALLIVWTGFTLVTM